MDAGVPKRLGLAALVAAAGIGASLGLVVAADPASSRAPGDELRPDLVVERPAELYLVAHKRKVRLRVSNTIANKGAGPLEIRGGGPSDSCSVPGKSQGRKTLQDIFKDSAQSPGYFTRGQDTDTPVEYEAGCSRFHPSHNHWHFDNFARYTLLRERNGRVIGRSRKVSFCVIDTGQPYPGLPGSPNNAYYPQDPPSSAPTCSETSVDGLSIGWEDTYGASLPGQVIEITGARRGRYCLVLEVDPPTGGSYSGNLTESNEHNNARTIKLRLRPKRGILKRLGSRCRAA